MTPSDYYRVLDLSIDASKEEIKKAYKMLALKYHPDKHQANASDEDKAAYTALFKQVQEAYETLKDDDKRAAYNKQLSNHRNSTANADQTPNHTQESEEKKPDLTIKKTCIDLIYSQDTKIAVLEQIIKLTPQEAPNIDKETQDLARLTLEIRKTMQACKSLYKELAPTLDQDQQEKLKKILKTLSNELWQQNKPNDCHRLIEEMLTNLPENNKLYISEGLKKHIDFFKAFEAYQSHNATYQNTFNHETKSTAQDNSSTTKTQSWRKQTKPAMKKHIKLADAEITIKNIDSDIKELKRYATQDDYFIDNKTRDLAKLTYIKRLVMGICENKKWENMLLPQSQMQAVLMRINSLKNNLWEKTTLNQSITCIQDHLSELNNLLPARYQNELTKIQQYESKLLTLELNEHISTTMTDCSALYHTVTQFLPAEDAAIMQESMLKIYYGLEKQETAEGCITLISETLNTLPEHLQAHASVIQEQSNLFKNNVTPKRDETHNSM